MGKYLRISSYIRKPFLIYDFATAPLWISLYMRKIWFSFYQCTVFRWVSKTRPGPFGSFCECLHRRTRISFTTGGCLLSISIRRDLVFSSSEYVNRNPSITILYSSSECFQPQEISCIYGVCLYLPEGIFFYSDEWHYRYLSTGISCVPPFNVLIPQPGSDNPLWVSPLKRRTFYAWRSPQWKFHIYVFLFWE